MVAVSVDEPSHSLRVVEQQRLPFSILSDVDRVVIRDYGLVHHAGGMSGEDIAIPALILLDRDRRVLWKRIAHRIQDRPSPDAVLARIRSVLGSG